MKTTCTAFQMKPYVVQSIASQNFRQLHMITGHIWPMPSMPTYDGNPTLQSKFTNSDSGS